MKASVKSQGGEGEDPDSRMDSERTDRRDKKGGKTKVRIILTTLDSCYIVYFFSLNYSVAVSQ